MARTIGRVDILVDFDGNRLPAKARAIAEKGGEQAGGAFNERFQQRFSELGRKLLPEMEKTGRLGGNRISNAMIMEIDRRLDGVSQRIARAFVSPSSLDEFAKDFKRVDDAALQLRRDLQLLRDEGSLNDKAFGEFHRTLNQWVHTAREAEKESDRFNEMLVNQRLEAMQTRRELEKHNTELDRTSEKFNKVSRDAERSSFRWRNLSHNLRQALLIIGAIAAGGEQIATLGMAAGVGLTVLGTAAVAGATGLGVLAIGLKGVTGEMEEIAPAARPAIQAFRDMGPALEELQQAVQGNLFADLEDNIKRVQNELLPEFHDGLAGIATSLNEVFETLLDSIVAPENILTFKNLLEGFQPIIESLGKAFISLGSFLGRVFEAGLPYAQAFADGLHQMFVDWAEWALTVEGQETLDKWFSDGTRVLGAFGDVLKTTGQLFQDLVDDETVDRTIRFLDNLEEALPTIGSILEALGELDAFGVIASALNGVLGLLRPFLDLLAPILGIFSDLVILFNEMLQPAALFLEVALLPLRIAFEAIGYVVTAVTEYMSDFWEELEPVREAIEEAAASIFEQLKPSLDQVIDTIIKLLPEPEELARLIQNEVIPAIEDWAKWIVEQAIPAIEKFIGNLEDLIDWIVNDLPGTIKTIEIWTTAFMRLFAGPIGMVMNLIDLLNIANHTSIPGAGSGGGGGGAALFTASGGVFDGAQARIIGEAGPEAVVPLDRDLSQVDPSVRWLSAIAQGKSAPSAPGGGRSTIVEAGAIQVIGVRDERQAASAVLDRIVAHTGS